MWLVVPNRLALSLNAVHSCTVAAVCEAANIPAPGYTAKISYKLVCGVAGTKRGSMSYDNHKATAIDPWQGHFVKVHSPAIIRQGFVVSLIQEEQSGHMPMTRPQHVKPDNVTVPSCTVLLQASRLVHAWINVSVRYHLL